MTVRCALITHSVLTRPYTSIRFIHIESNRLRRRISLWLHVTSACASAFALMSTSTLALYKWWRKHTHWQESPPAWMQEAYRLPCSKCSLCCYVSWQGRYTHPVPMVEYPHPVLTWGKVPPSNPDRGRIPPSSSDGGGTRPSSPDRGVPYPVLAGLYPQPVLTGGVPQS